MGMRPVINEARPAVQLAWPYQLVKTAPSLAILSMLGVGWPRVAPPPEYAPKSFHPVSSVMSMTMLGLLFWAALGTEPAASTRLETASAPSKRFRNPTSRCISSSFACCRIDSVNGSVGGKHRSGRARRNLFSVLQSPSHPRLALVGLSFHFKRGSLGTVICDRSAGEGGKISYFA